MSDQSQPEKKPEKPPEQNAQTKSAPAASEPVKPSDVPKEAPKAAEAPAMAKPTDSAPAAAPPPAPDKPAPSAPESKPASGDEITARAVKAPAAAESAKETPKPADAKEEAPQAEAAPSSPPSAAAAPIAPESDAAPKPAAPPTPAAPKPADAPASSAPAAAPTAQSSATSSGPGPLPPSSAPAAPPAASMQQRCPNCGHRNRPGVLICENCGTNLVTGKASVAGTRDLLREQEEQAAAASTASARPGTAPLIDTSELKAVQSAGSHVFEDTMVLRIEIEGGTTPILVYPKQEIIFGRRDPTSGGMPDVDLTPYAGYRMGVSRRHAAIRLQEKRLDVSDLGSSNGTFLNGTRLSAHRPYQLRDGDEVRLGQMMMRVFFQTNTGRK